MALLFMDGFGGGDYASKWDLGSAPYTASTASPRIAGSYYAQFTSGGSGSMAKNFPAASRIFLGFGFYLGERQIIGFFGDNAVTNHITVLRNDVSGYLEIRRGPFNGTLLATGTQSIPNNTWNYIEISVTVSDTVGEVHVRLNGSTTDEVSYVGDTKNGGTANTIDRITISFNNSFLHRLADLYILNDTGSVNNTFLGDVVVRTLSPTGNGTYSQLVGSDSNSTDNYLLVDEHPYSATDYVGSATPGQKDTYAMADLPAGVSTIHAVQVTGSMAKNDATLGQARYIIRAGGSDYGGTNRALSTTFTTYSDIHEVNPATGVAWTPRDVNNMETGMEIV